MQILIFALWAVQCSRVLGHPYIFENTWVAAQTTSITNLLPAPETNGAVLYEKRGYGEILHVRDTTAITDSTSTTETASETSISSTSTSSTSSTTSSTSSSTSTSGSTTISSTTSSTTSTSLSTSSTSTSSSSTTTTSSSTKTATTATATSSSTAHLDAWNRKGNIAAIVFGCCLVSLFIGISIVHCARDRAKARRIAARELLKSGSSYSLIPPTAAKGSFTPEVKMDRSSTMFTNNPQADYFPTPRSTPSVSNYHNHTPSATLRATEEHASSVGQTS